MRRPRHDRQPQSQPTRARSGLWGSRASLIGGVIVYLGLAGLAMRWRPDQPFIASIWIFLAAHSAAYLVVREVRESRDNREC